MNPAEGSAHYRVGIATVDVTPPVGSPLAGFAARGEHGSTGVYHPLRAVVVTIDEGMTPVVLVSVEWLGFYDLATRVRAAIAEAIGIGPDRVVLAGTHTHCGPAIRAGDVGRYGRVDWAYVRVAVERIVSAARRAWQERTEARLSYGVGRCAVAMSRRAPDPARPGRVRPGSVPNPDGPTDHDVPVLVVRDLASDTVRGVVFSYACHPTAGAGLEIGGDYVAFAYDRLAAALGAAQPCFFTGCAGDQNPRPATATTPSTRRSVEEIQALGEELGDAVLAAVRSGDLRPLSGPMSVQRSVVELTTEPGAEPISDADRRVPLEVQTLTLGRSLALVAMAAEPTVEHGLRLKRELSTTFDAVLPLGYANEIMGYLPVRRQFAELGYEVLDANLYYGRSGRFSASTEERVHEQIGRMLGGARRR